MTRQDSREGYFAVPAAVLVSLLLRLHGHAAFAARNPAKTESHAQTSQLVLLLYPMALPLFQGFESSLH